MIKHCVSLLITLTISVTVLLMVLLTVTPATAAEGLNGRVVQVDLEGKKVTIAAVMGHKALRVLNVKLLENVKVGDQIKFTTGQDGNEVVVTGIEVMK